MGRSSIGRAVGSDPASCEGSNPSAPARWCLMKRKRKKGGDIVKSCLSKIKYDNEDDAWEAAMWQTKQKGCGYECCPTYDFYKCIFCEGYHTYKER